MNTSYRRSSPFRIPGYSQNAVLQLIVATGLGFVLYHATRVSMIVFGVTGGAAKLRTMTYVAMPPLHDFARHAWTILTYGWVHDGFMEWISNMIWLFTFGNVVQNLVGYRQVLPTFIYGLTIGGLFNLGTQFIPGLVPQANYVMTSTAGVMALASATITLAPKYRFYLGENLSIPLIVVVGIYLVLNLLSFAAHLPMLALCVGGLLTGWGMMRLIQRGYRPGAWMYNITGSIGNSMTPTENEIRKSRRNNPQNIQLTRRNSEQDFSQRSVDEILDKIHSRGFNSLTAKEREILEAAAKENQD